MASVRVAVRIRPLNKREKQLASKVIIHMKGNTTSISKSSPTGEEELKSFSYDFSYDSTDRGSPTFASQERIFRDLGSDVLKAAFEGFNACMFAYGQTGSGKSYTMMGHTDDKGLIPRICEGLFCEIAHRSKSDAVSFRTEVSYSEIYNERVQDLLKKRAAPTDGAGLRVREHPRDGPYVENLSKHLVHNHSDMEDLIALGNASRTTASTGMNISSSRSHAIFTISFTQARFDAELPRETLSKIHLVDLAGSERADATRTTGARLKEGANINKSLVTLGTVISALADLRSVGELSTKKKKQIFIPYRDSVLTWLLKDSLGGNSLTTMIATISPAEVNYGETLSTLRYASRAKNIVNSPTVNEDGSVKVIRELQAEVARLRRLLEEASQVSHVEPSASVKVEEELHQNEEKVQALTKEWTSKWGETQTILQEEAVALRKEGVGVVLDCQLPHLIGIDEDRLSSGIVLYYLKEGRTLIGSDAASCRHGIVLLGPGILGEHCVLENHARTVTLIPQDGSLCSINGCVVTDPCQLTQGAILQLGRGTILRFNHPTEAAQLRDKHQSALPSPFPLSLTDVSKSTENLSKVMLQNPGMDEELSQPEVEWCRVQGILIRRNQNIKTASKRNSWEGAEERTTGAEMEETSDGQIEMRAAETAESKVPGGCLTPATENKLVTTAIPGKYPVPHVSFQLDGVVLQGGVSTRDGQEQERDSCHKSGPRLMSERPWRKAQSGAGAASYKGEDVWSGDASLQQTSVLGLGDGCGTKAEGNANESRGVVTDCYEGRPGSGGNSLGSVSHLQSGGGTIFTSVLPPTSAHSRLDDTPFGSQAARRPPEETTFEGQISCGEMDETGGLEGIPGACITKTQNSGLSSLVSRVSWMVQDAGRLLWSSPTVLQQVREEGLQPVGARWSSHVVSMVRESNVLSVVKDSQVFSMVKGSFVFSLLKDSLIFSLVKELPLVQHIQMEITQNLQPKEAAQVIQGRIHPNTTHLPVLTPTQTFSTAEELPHDMPLIPENIWTENTSMKDLHLPQEHDMATMDVKLGHQLMTQLPPAEQISQSEVTHVAEDKDQTLKNSRTTDVQIFSQTLIEFPDSLLKLQTLPLLDIMDTLQSIISSPVLSSQKTVALCWLHVAKCSQPEPRPGLLILVETGVYILTSDSGLLVLFHHLPLLHLKDVQINFAGHSLRLMGATEESILGVYTYSQKLTKELCLAILGIIYPGDDRVSQHPLLEGDLMKMSLDLQTYVPDLLLDAGLRVCCHFQKSLTDLVYLLHCNMDQEMVTMGEVQLLFYTGVRVCISTKTWTESLAQLLLTDTHLGLVQECAVFHPAPRSATTAPCRPQFYNLTLRQRSDVRCVMVHDEDERGDVRLDVILANVRGRGHPESVTKTATLPAHASNSSLHAEVWKLTFSCSSEAACLLNHLSNV